MDFSPKPVFYRGKKIQTTTSFRRELYDVYRKELDLIIELLEEG
jgi:hypothetical protein